MTSMRPPVRGRAGGGPVSIIISATPAGAAAPAAANPPKTAGRAAGRGDGGYYGDGYDEGNRHPLPARPGKNKDKRRAPRRAGCR